MLSGDPARVATPQKLPADPCRERGRKSTRGLIGSPWLWFHPRLPHLSLASLIHSGNHTGGRPWRDHVLFHPAPCRRMPCLLLLPFPLQRSVCSAAACLFFFVLVSRKPWPGLLCMYAVGIRDWGGCTRICTTRHPLQQRGGKNLGKVHASKQSSPSRIIALRNGLTFLQDANVPSFTIDVQAPKRERLSHLMLPSQSCAAYSASRYTVPKPHTSSRNQWTRFPPPAVASSPNADLTLVAIAVGSIG